MSLQEIFMIYNQHGVTNKTKLEVLNAIKVYQDNCHIMIIEDLIRSLETDSGLTPPPTTEYC